MDLGSKVIHKERDSGKGTIKGVVSREKGLFTVWWVDRKITIEDLVDLRLSDDLILVSVPNELPSAPEQTADMIFTLPGGSIGGE